MLLHALKPQFEVLLERSPSLLDHDLHCSGGIGNGNAFLESCGIKVEQFAHASFPWLLLHRLAGSVVRTLGRHVAGCEERREHLGFLLEWFRRICRVEEGLDGDLFVQRVATIDGHLDEAEELDLSGRRSLG